MLELLQDRPLVPGRVGVAWEEQHRQAADRRLGGAGDHVRRTGADGRRARERRATARRLRVADGGVDHRLLVVALEERELGAVLVDGLPEAVHVPVSEDAEHPRHEAPGVPVAFAELHLQEADDRLRGRQPDCASRQGVLLTGFRGTRPSSDPSSPRSRSAGPPCRHRCPSARRTASGRRARAVSS